VRLLVPIDGSDPSLHALDVASEFASRLHAELVVCHVVDLARVAMLSGGQAQLIPGCLEEVESEGKSLLGDALARVDRGVRTASRSVKGAPVDEILRLAAEIRPEFIVMGTHGRTGLGRVLMGSVAEGVVRGALVPVMVVPYERRSL